MQSLLLPQLVQTNPGTRVTSWLGRGAFGRLGFLFLAALPGIAILFGTARVTRDEVQESVVHVRPGSSLEDLVNKYPPGTHFKLPSGTFRLRSVIKVKNGNAFVGEPGAVLSGAQPLTDFSKEASYWVANVKVNQRSSPRGTCAAEHPECASPEDLFMDDIPQERAQNLAELAPGKWFLDYEAGKAYLASNPESHKVEISLTPKAFGGTAEGVRIEGLVIEKFASLAGEGAIDASAGRNAPRPSWVIQNNEVRFNHGAGIRLGDGVEVLRNRIHHNGQLGIAGSGKGMLIEGNEIAFNNYAGYSYGWEAGGLKFTFSRDVTIRENEVHDNHGPGLWSDLENQDTIYERNHTRDNKVAGILHEVSYEAVIRSNEIEHDGYAADGKTSPWYGAGILIAGSSGVEVYGNRLTDCMNGIVGTQPRRKSSRSGKRYLLRDLYVHDNTVSQRQGVAAGIVKATGMEDEIFTSWNNRFSNNLFDIASPSTRQFAWMNAMWMLDDWKIRFRKN